MSRRARPRSRSSYSDSDSGYEGSPRPSAKASSARKRSERPSPSRAGRFGGVSRSSSRKVTAGGSEWNKKDTTTQPASHGIPTAFANVTTNQSVAVAAFLDSVSGETGDKDITWYTHSRATNDSDMELKEAWAKYTDDHGQVHVQNFSGEEDPDEEE